MNATTHAALGLATLAASIGWTISTPDHTPDTHQAPAEQAKYGTCGTSKPTVTKSGAVKVRAWTSHTCRP